MKHFSFAALLFWPVLASAQLVVTISPVTVAGQKALVPLAIKNNLAEKVESARGVVFLLDDRGKVLGQASRWIIGGSRDNPGLAAGATNSFHFVVASEKPFVTTNVTAKVSLSRVVLSGGKLADVAKDVSIVPAPN